MHRVFKISEKIRPPERLLVAFILFYGALVFCLPVPFSDEVAQQYPWWAKRIDPGNVLLSEILFILWIALYGGRFVQSALLNIGVPTRFAALCLILLALWCGLISLVAPLPIIDIGRTFRLLLLSVMLVAVVRWTRQMGDFPLLVLLLGFLTGTVINLIISFQIPFIVYDTMRLHGQNTPGVWMAIAIHLAAWLFFHSTKPRVHIFSIITVLVCAFGVGLSYSRIGWLSGAFGILAWVYILFLAKQNGYFARIRLRRFRRLWLPLLMIVSVIGLFSSGARDNLHSIQSLIQQKDWVVSDSNEQRFSYFIGTAEIVAKHPFGVGYSGFYDAMTATDVYRSGKAAHEVSPIEANPHATFLWYTTTGGVIGVGLALVLFVLLLRSMRIGLSNSMGRPGRVLFYLIAGPMFLIGMTVPYLFNSIIFIVPTAIAAGWGWSRQQE